MSTVYKVGPHRVSVGSIDDRQIDRMLGSKRIEVMYSDPPWGDGNVKFWATMAKKQAGIDVRPMAFTELLAGVERFLPRIDGWAFIEMGERWESLVIEMCQRHFAHVTTFGGRYRGGKDLLPYRIVAASNLGTFEAPDDWTRTGYKAVIGAVRAVATPGAIAFDPCCGLGYTARAALETGMVFYGNELSPARAAETLAKLEKGTLTAA